MADKEATSHVGIGTLDAIQQGKRGDANGDPMGNRGMAGRPCAAEETAGGAGPSISSHLSIDARGSNMTADQFRVGFALPENNRVAMKPVPDVVKKARSRMKQADDPQVQARFPAGICR
ncbi:hypothetical protein [Xanthobacter sediminis]|uniref:hypothetical protein n=1 Tax=Xanthobacter sediminis TaxID=3119926 RepID=UPI003729EE07